MIQSQLLILQSKKPLSIISNKLYPTLSIVGEEDPSKYEHIAPTVEDIDEKIKSIVDEQILRDTYEQRKEALENSQYKDILSADPFSFNASNAELFVDPLDGTRDFLENRLPNVTCLIGLTLDKVSKVGVIHSPFKDNEGVTPGSTYFGSLETGLFEHLNDDIKYIPPFENEIEDPDAHKLSITVTVNRFNSQLQTMVDNLEPCEYIREGGCGRKCISVFEEKVDAFVYPQRGMSGWDSCAPEALIKARLGSATDIQSLPFVYSKDMGKINGIIITKTPQIHNIVTKRLKTFISALKATI